MNCIKKVLVNCNIYCKYKGKYLFIVLLPIVSAAQEIEKSYEEKKRNYYFSPSISVRQEFTNNAKLDKSNKNGSLTQLIPGIRWIGNGANIKGFADYSLTASVDSEGVQRHYVRNRLNANAIVEVVEQLAFFDISGSISTQPISAFGNPIIDSRPNSNSAEVKNFQISPYIIGSVGDNFNYEARYSVQEIKSGAENIGNSQFQKIRMNLESPVSGKTFRWSALASYENSDFDYRRSISTGTLRGALIYGMTPQMVFSLIGGGESTDQISPKKETHSIIGLGAQWRPSQQTKISASGERRYFGNAHNIILEHNTGKILLRYTDIKGISNGLGGSSAISGSVFDLLNGFYTQIEPDPVLRTKLVLNEIERLGMTSETQVFKDFLRSTNTLKRTQRLSFIILGKRNTVTLSAYKVIDNKIDETLNTKDDFERNENISQKGLSLLMSHRLNFNTALFSNIDLRKNSGTSPGLKNTLLSVKLGINKNLSRRTNIGVQLNRSLVDQGIGRYGESSVMGTMTHRF